MQSLTFHSKRNVSIHIYYRNYWTELKSLLKLLCYIHQKRCYIHILLRRDQQLEWRSTHNGTIKRMNLILRVKIGLFQCKNIFNAREFKIHQPRRGHTLAKWPGSPQMKHLPVIGSPVADTNDTPLVFGPPWPRPPLLLLVNAEVFVRSPPLRVSSQLQCQAKKVYQLANYLNVIKSSE